MRSPRQLKKRARYHVIARANRREHILNTPEIKQMFLTTLERAKKKYDFTIINFCIMENHVHLLIKPLGNENLSRIMRWILSVFAIKFNKMFHYVGHVWYDRFKSKIIDDIRQFLHTFIYIANNPVRANIVKAATDFEYNGISHILKGLSHIIDRPPNHELKTIWQGIRK